MYYSNKEGDIIHNSLLKAVSILTIFTVITRAIGFIFKVYLSNMLTPEELGIYTITISIYMLLLTFVTGNISTTVSKNISQNQYNKDFTHKFTTNSIMISLLVGIFIIVFVILGKDLFKAIFTDDMSYTLLLTLLPSILFMAICKHNRICRASYKNSFKRNSNMAESV